MSNSVNKLPDKFSVQVIVDLI